MHPESAVRHCVMMTARDANGKLKVERATIFDSGAYFNVEAPVNGKGGSVVKGGLAWSFPGPCLYELSLAQAGPGAPSPPLSIRMRMVSRFDEMEQMSEREAKEHPLVSARAARRQLQLAQRARASPHKPFRRGKALNLVHQ